MTEPFVLQCSNTYFIRSQDLGAIEGAVYTALAIGLRSKRRIEVNHIQQILKTLRLIPHSEKVVAIGIGCIDTGTTGLFVLCESPHHVQGNIPSQGNFAEERARK